MSIFKCSTPCTNTAGEVQQPCRIVVTTDASPESCPYRFWSENDFPEWIEESAAEFIEGANLHPPTGQMCSVKPKLA